MLAYYVRDLEIVLEDSVGTQMTDRDVSERKWGRYEILYQGPANDGYIKVKRLILNPLSSTSRQRHKFREEHFFPLLGMVMLVMDARGTSGVRGCNIIDGDRVPPGKWHQLINETEKPASVLEVQIGSVVSEDDIERAG